MSRKRGKKQNTSNPSKKAKTDNNNDMPDLEQYNSPQYAPASPPYALASPQYAPASPPYAPASPQYAPSSPQYAPSSSQHNPQLLEPQQANADIIRELTNLGEEITTFFNSNSETLDAPREQYEGIKNNVLQVLENVFSQHQTDLARLRQEREANNLQMIAEENTRMLQELRQGFLTNIQQVTNDLTTELTIQEQSTLYKEILDFIHNKQSDAAYIRELQNEPDHLNRFAEIINIAYNLLLEQISLSISNIIVNSPEKIKQITAILASMLMLYSYQPVEVRTLYNNIPYFGSLFQTMNQTNNILRATTNSAGTVTTIYYLLRNSGINVDEGIGLVRSMISQSASSLLERTPSMASTTAAMASTTAAMASTTAAMASRTANVTISVTGSVLNSLGRQLSNKIGTILTSEYNDMEIPFDSQSTENTNIVSNRSSRSYNTATSRSTAASYKSIQELLETPIEEGGINGLITVTETLDETEKTIIDDRFNAIIDGNNTNPVLQGITEEGNIDTASPPPYSSQNSNISELSDESVSWQLWLYGKDNSFSGGRRRRRIRCFSRRVKRVSRKMRRRGRKTRKGKRRYKTLKKH
jgi:hypothetical protein